MSSQVKYVLLAEFVNRYQYYFYNTDSAFLAAPDITITYNQNLLNEISFSLYATPENKYDFVTLALRDIAKGLGFNWSFQANVNQKRMSVDTNLCTPYEECIMQTINTEDPYQIYNQATTGSLNLSIPQYGDITLYAPQTWQQGISLNSFIPDSTKNITELLSNQFGKGTVIRDITDNYTALFKNALGWNPHEAPVGAGSTQSNVTYTNNEQALPYGGSISETNNRKLPENRILTQQAISQKSPMYQNTTFSIDDYCTPYDPNYISKGAPLSFEGYIIALLKKDGLWDIIYSTDEYDLNVNLNNIIKTENTNQYARTCDGYLRCRVNHCSLATGYGKIYRKLKTKYYVLDYLPQNIEQSFSGVMPNVYTRSVDDEYLRDIKIGIKNLEGTERIIVEQLNEGERIPSKFEVKDFKKGYFIATVDKEFYSQFTVVAYNKNGGTRSETLTIEPLEPVTQNYNVEVLDNEINISSTRKRSTSKKLLVGYEICPLNEFTKSTILKANIEDDNVTINTSSLSKGTYVLSYYDSANKKHSMKFSKK